MKQQINFRASTLTTKQLEWLMSEWGTSQTETLTVVIDRIYDQENVTMKTKNYEEKARARVERSSWLNQYEKVIFLPWPNWDEHMKFIATAKVFDIVNWAETVDISPVHDGPLFPESDSTCIPATKYAPCFGSVVIEVSEAYTYAGMNTRCFVSQWIRRGAAFHLQHARNYKDLQEEAEKEVKNLGGSCDISGIYPCSEDLAAKADWSLEKHIAWNGPGWYKPHFCRHLADNEIIYHWAARDQNKKPKTVAFSDPAWLDEPKWFDKMPHEANDFGFREHYAEGFIPAPRKR